MSSVWWMHHLSLLTQRRSLQTPITTIQNPSRRTSLIRTIIQKTITTASSTYIPLPISTTRRNTSSFGARKAMSSLTALAICPCANSLQQRMLQITPQRFGLLEDTNGILPIRECTLIADKGYDVKKVYNTVKNIYDGDCVISLNPRNKKNPKTTAVGNIVCEAGFAMHKDGKDSSSGPLRQKDCYPFKNSGG